ncbi:MAG TPA: bifunctional helix-turn-helix transcriptional regulator/GNAT family N-acetyltransferase [Acidimicrobiales bacterium]|nr:bifunctional helix-turn-helix transcriptional regulator/GNAT family N-acetyltransferase [Acidimicrobiales bacterium]
MVDRAMVDRVRSFSRTVTQRVGALDDHFLSRDRALGESRLLWEIGEDGCDVRRLRSGLDLDSGYVSRLLRSLEADGLVTVAPSPADKRVRTARLTASGMCERVELDRRADDLAWSLLAPLDEHHRDRLVAAMGEVERLLTAALVRFEVVDPTDERARYCLREYFAELDRRFEGGFEPGRSLATPADELRPPRGAVLLAALRDEPVGSAMLMFEAGGTALIKRMWLSPTVRGLGVGRRLLAALEEQAKAGGAHTIRLETNRVLTEAISLYRSTGYEEVEAFNDEAYAHHWFAKRL